MSERPSWVKACVGSVIVHVVMIAGATALPDGAGPSGARTRDQLFTPGAVIPIETVPLAMLEPSGEQPAPDPSAEQPALAPTKDGPSLSSPSPDNGHARPPAPTQAESRPSETPGLLTGMRANAHASAIAERGGVVVDPALLRGSHAAYRDGVDMPGVGSGGVQGPAGLPNPAADYVFGVEKGKRVYKDPNGHFVATLRADGRVDFRNKAGKASWTQLGIGDPGGLLSKAAGSDPNARLKAKLLKATFEMRLGMAVKFQKRQLDKGLARLEKDLDKIWTDARHTLPARKVLVFERWDECEEPGDLEPGAIPGFGESDTSELDKARQEAAGAARRKIVKFIRGRAPKDSADAYTTAELSKLNARRVSTQPFKPY